MNDQVQCNKSDGGGKFEVVVVEVLVLSENRRGLRDNELPSNTQALRSDQRS